MLAVHLCTVLEGGRTVSKPVARGCQLSFFFVLHAGGRLGRRHARRRSRGRRGGTGVQLGAARFPSTSRVGFNLEEVWNHRCQVRDQNFVGHDQEVPRSTCEGSRKQSSRRCKEPFGQDSEVGTAVSTTQLTSASKFVRVDPEQADSDASAGAPAADFCLPSQHLQQDADRKEGEFHAWQHKCDRRCVVCKGRSPGSEVQESDQWFQAVRPRCTPHPFG